MAVNNDDRGCTEMPGVALKSKIAVCIYLSRESLVAERGVVNLNLYFISQTQRDSATLLRGTVVDPSLRAPRVRRNLPPQWVEGDIAQILSCSDAVSPSLGETFVIPCECPRWKQLMCQYTEKIELEPDLCPFRPAPNGFFFTTTNGQARETGEVQFR
jgi:hypothetical protein